MSPFPPFLSSIEIISDNFGGGDSLLGVMQKMIFPFTSVLFM
jgi:hypothetical protein